MTQVNSGSPKITQAQYSQMLQQYDVNKDGKIDQQDIEKLKGDNIGLGIACAIPFGAFVAAPQLAANIEKIKAMETLLGGQSDKTIDASDIQQAQCSKAYQSEGCGTATKTNDLKSELSKMDLSQFPESLKKLLASLFSELGIKNESLANASNQTSGQGQTSGTDNSKTPQSTSSASGTNTNNATNSGTSGSNSTSGTNNTDKTSDTDNTKSTDSSNSTEASSGSSSNELQSMLDDVRGVNKELKDLWSEYRGCKDEGKKRELMTKIQEKNQWKTELNQFMTNWLKTQHEQQMAIIRNLR